MGSVIFVILLLLVFALIYVANSVTPFKCQKCEVTTNMNHKKDMYCPVCRKNYQICDTCFEKQEDRARKHDIWCCIDCFEKYHNKAEDFIVVKSSHIGKHDILEKSDKTYVTSTEYKDRQRAVEELKYTGIKLGYNGLINLKFKRVTYTHDNGYIENFNKASGVYVKVKKRKGGKK